MGHTTTLDAFLNLHRDQLLSSAIPEHFWPTLHEKILKQLFNAGDTFRLLQIEYEDERQPHEPCWGLQTITDVKKSDPKQIYLIDHAWTFRVGHAKNQLLQFDSLRNRLCNMLGVRENRSSAEISDEIFDKVWKLCNTYSIGNAENIEDRMPVWYVMDEIGSAVMHSDKPNCRMVPFVYVNSQITYSLIFPTKDIQEGGFIFRDFAEGISGNTERAAALLPWVPYDFRNLPQIPEIPNADYYLSGHIRETLPDLKNAPEKVVLTKYRVYTEYNLIKQYLTDPSFELVDLEEEGDILWLTRHFKDYEKLSTEKFINQFPFEYVLTIKDLLNLTCRRSKNPKKIHPITYNLKTEIGNFLSFFQSRQDQNLDNHWIIKPYNLARSLDTHITNNIDYIIRLPATGPKIAQKYINDPVLFNRPECGSVKFDIRYVILLESVKPLKAYVHKEFYLRFANKPFELRDFHVYEKHFTVMNYEEDAEMKHMLCSQFKRLWEAQYPLFGWDKIEELILKLLKEVLELGVAAEPPCGMAHSPQSRALYAADLMLEWTEKREIEPRILEINWTPDCQRACLYYPDFYNDIFRLLFLNKKSDVFIEL